MTNRVISKDLRNNSRHARGVERRFGLRRHPFQWSPNITVSLPFCPYSRERRLSPKPRTTILVSVSPGEGYRTSTPCPSPRKDRGTGVVYVSNVSDCAFRGPWRVALFRTGGLYRGVTRGRYEGREPGVSQGGSTGSRGTPGTGHVSLARRR